MASYNIEINYLNSSGSYDILYPKIGQFSCQSIPYTGIGSITNTVFDGNGSRFIFVNSSYNYAMLGLQRNNVLTKVADDGTVKFSYLTVVNYTTVNLSYYFVKAFATTMPNNSYVNLTLSKIYTSDGTSFDSKPASYIFNDLNIKYFLFIISYEQ